MVDLVLYISVILLLEAAKMVTGVTSAIYLFKMFPAIDLRDSNVLCSSMIEAHIIFFSL